MSRLEYVRKVVGRHCLVSEIIQETPELSIIWCEGASTARLIKSELEDGSCLLTIRKGNISTHFYVIARDA